MMSVLLLWWFMISLASILLSRNELKDTDIVNIDTLIRISLRIPYYFYWYLLTIIEQYTIMIHNQIKNQTTVVMCWMITLYHFTILCITLSMITWEWYDYGVNIDEIIGI